MNKLNNTLFAAILLIVFAAFTRLFPHYPNFTAIGAIAIFGGSVIKDKKLAVLLPLAALLLSDICLQLFGITRGFYGGQFFVYGAFLIIALLATLIKKPSAGNVTFAAVWAGVIFFLVSNFGVFILSNGIYPRSFAGLMACYTAAIPFYKNEFFGNFSLNLMYSNLFYSALLFGAYYIWQSNMQLQKAKA